MAETLEDGTDLLYSGRYYSAQKVLTRIAQAEPDNRAAQEWLLLSFFAVNEASEALDYLQAWEKTGSRLDLARQRVALEQLASFGAGKRILPPAGRAYRPPYATAFLTEREKRMLSRYRGFYPQNMRYLENVLLLFPRDTPDRIPLSLPQIDSLLWNDNAVEAARLVNRALDVPGMTPMERSVLLTVLAQLFIQQNDFHNAIAPPRQAVELWPFNRAAHFLLQATY